MKSLIRTCIGLVLFFLFPSAPSPALSSEGEVVTFPSGELTLQASSSPGQEARGGTSGRRLPALSIPEGGTSLEGVEHALVEMALHQSHGNQIKAAKLLDISRDALRYKMKKFGLAHGEEEQQPSTTHS